MAKVTAGKQSAYNMALQASAKRKAIVEHGMARSESMRSYMVANINKTAAAQVQSTEQQLRSKSAAASKARLASLNKLA